MIICNTINIELWNIQNLLTNETSHDVISPDEAIPDFADQPGNTQQWIESMNETRKRKVNAQLTREPFHVPVRPRKVTQILRREAV